MGNPETKATLGHGIVQNKDNFCLTFVLGIQSITKIAKHKWIAY